MAIPLELNKSQQVELVKKFTTEQFVNSGMIADVAFHELDSHNPHAHIMLTMRDIDAQGFKKKNRDWNKRGLLEKQRKAWSTYANSALAEAGKNERIDHRTLEAQGINRIPQIHLGSAVTAMAKRGILTDKYEQYLEIEKANLEIANLEKGITDYEIATNFQGLDNLAENIVKFQELKSLNTISNSLKLLAKNLVKSEYIESLCGIPEMTKLLLLAEEEFKKLEQFDNKLEKLEKKLEIIEKRAEESGIVELLKMEKYQRQYSDLTKEILQKLGRNISLDRLDLEIYLKLKKQTDLPNVAKIISHSPLSDVCQNSFDKGAKYYFEALCQVAPIYEDLSKKKIANLDQTARKIICARVIELQEQDQKISLELQQEKRRGRHL